MDFVEICKVFVGNAPKKIFHSGKICRLL